MVTQYKNTLQILIKYKNLIIKLIAKKTKIIEAYCHQMCHLLVYNTSNQVCHNCILIIHAFSRVCTIVLQLLRNLTINLPIYHSIFYSLLNLFGYWTLNIYYYYYYYYYYPIFYCMLRWNFGGSMAFKHQSLLNM